MVARSAWRAWVVLSMSSYCRDRS
ncbi:DUF3649 domain-containing protein [Micromonospora sp. NPDC000207]